MEVSSASKAPVPQAPPPKRVEPPAPEQQPKAAQKAPEPPKTEEPKPRPVVNTQGQTIGTRLNVQA